MRAVLAVGVVAVVLCCWVGVDAQTRPVEGGKSLPTGFNLEVPLPNNTLFKIRNGYNDSTVGHVGVYGTQSNNFYALTLFQFSESLPILAGAGGVVRVVEDSTCSGAKRIQIECSGEVWTTYDFLEIVTVAQGATVETGQVIGSVGIAKCVGSPAVTALHFQANTGGGPAVGNATVPEPFGRAQILNTASTYISFTAQVGTYTTTGVDPTTGLATTGVSNNTCEVYVKCTAAAICNLYRVANASNPQNIIGSVAVGTICEDLNLNGNDRGWRYVTCSGQPGFAPYFDFEYENSVACPEPIPPNIPPPSDSGSSLSTWSAALLLGGVSSVVLG